MIVVLVSAFERRSRYAPAPHHRRHMIRKAANRPPPMHEEYVERSDRRPISPSSTRDVVHKL